MQSALGPMITQEALNSMDHLAQLVQELRKL
jgi:hypothetical protein